MNGAIWVRNLRAFLAFRSISYSAVPRRNCRVSCAGPPLMSSSSAMVVLVAISTSVTAMGLLARYRPAGLQAATAPRTRRPGRCARGVPEGRPCGPTAQELQAGMPVLPDRGFKCQPGLRRDKTRRGGLLAARAGAPLLVGGCLQGEELGVAACGGKQFVVVAGLDDAAFVQHVNAVAGAHGREAVRDEQHRAAGEQFPDPGEQPVLGFGVERGSGLVEDHQRRVAEE